MLHTMWKLNNVIKNYDWGSKSELSQLFHIDNPNNLPQAEMWMGIHPAGVSTAIDTLGEAIKLDKLIATNPCQILGENAYKKYHNLSYLFKVLSAQLPLSIQVHPNIEKAKLGYEKENQLKIPLDSPIRNYKDPNHKPELIYALTPFWAMNGFRPIEDIIALFSLIDIAPIQNGFDMLLKAPSSSGLKNFFSFLLKLDVATKQQAIAVLKTTYHLLNDEIATLIDKLIDLYPNDSGVFSPLFLNIIQLKPGQAMFLKAETPHAYLEGSGLEIMANSDNVLRAGLTHKHIDIDELLENTKFDSTALSQLLTASIQFDNKVKFPVPITDFVFEIIYSKSQHLIQKVNSAEIIFCIEGSVSLSTKTDCITINAGESVFIAECAKTFKYKGQGFFARIFSR